MSLAVSAMVTMGSAQQQPLVTAGWMTGRPLLPVVTPLSEDRTALAV